MKIVELPTLATATQSSGTRLRWFRSLSVVAFILLTNVSLGLVNPSLQPNDLFDRNRIVVTLRVVSVDIEAKLVQLEVEQVCKGKLSAKQVQVSLSGAAAEEAANQLLVEGGTVVAFVGKSRAGQEDKLIFYPGDGRWQAGRLEKTDDPARWVWDQDLGLDLFGTFNGAADRLAEMMTDVRDGRYFFPATPFAGFKKDLPLGTLAGPARGVALYDLDGDGRPDVVACSEQGNRIWLQTGLLTFTDRTKELGLKGSASPSVTIGDLNGDGIPDLLLGAQVYLGAGTGQQRTFTKAPLLPAEAGANLKCAAFVDINGDGWPDVVVSRHGKGLAVYLNPGAKGGPFTNSTSALGLDKPECGTDGDGFFAAGDWDGDGHCDLFYAVRTGLIMVRGADGRFAPVEHGLDLGLEDAEVGLGGTAAFAPLWSRNGSDLAFATSVGVHLLVNVKNRVRERTGAANELAETSSKQLALIAEDLDADGTVDLFVASRDQLPCKFFANRGYGSFTCPTKYKAGIIPEVALQFGAWGLAAGDANGDGANDLLLGGVDGRVLLLVNGTLDDRPLQPPENAKFTQQVLARSRILSVTVTGRGTMGAEVVLTEEAGRVLSRRTVGDNIVTGCRSPDTLNFAVREPGPLKVTVRYTDGVVKSWPVDLAIKERRAELQAGR